MYNFIINGADPVSTLLFIIVYFLFMFGCLAVITIVVCTIAEDNERTIKRKHNHPHQ